MEHAIGLWTLYWNGQAEAHAKRLFHYDTWPSLSDAHELYMLRATCCAVSRHPHRFRQPTGELLGKRARWTTNSCIDLRSPCKLELLPEAKAALISSQDAPGSASDCPRVQDSSRVPKLLYELPFHCLSNGHHVFKSAQHACLSM